VSAGISGCTFFVTARGFAHFAFFAGTVLSAASLYTACSAMALGTAWHITTGAAAHVAMHIAPSMAFVHIGTCATIFHPTVAGLSALALMPMVLNGTHCTACHK
jgi:hypothetical protein